MFPVKILYEDEAILVAFKPAGLPMHTNLDSERTNFVGLLQEKLAKRDGRPGYLGIHQRLDLGTSGLVIFTRCQEANASLAKQFFEHSLSKIYLTIVAAHGHLASKEWDCRYALGEPNKRGGAVRWRHNPQTSDLGFKEAWTHFILKKRKHGLLLLQAELKSGRKHQIRAHLAAQKMPILGDTLYGGADRIKIEDTTFMVERPLLHSYALKLIHPLSGTPLQVVAPLPTDFVNIMAVADLGEVKDYET
ncbi:TPA: hypothetical protein DD394_00790 [bacterium UBP9_UBA11836]|nr:hypothetical protein [bacterium UBP9_UBA11836]